MSPAIPSEQERRAARLAELRDEIRRADGRAGAGRGRPASPRQRTSCLVSKAEGVEPSLGTRSPRGVGKRTRNLSVDLHARSAVLDFTPLERVDPSDPSSPARTWIRKVGGKAQTPHLRNCEQEIAHKERRKLAEPRAVVKDRFSKRFGTPERMAPGLMGSVHRSRSLPSSPRNGSVPRPRGKRRAESPGRQSLDSPFVGAADAAPATPDRIFQSSSYTARQVYLSSSGTGGGGGARFAASPRAGSPLRNHNGSSTPRGRSSDLAPRHYHYCKVEHRTTSLPPNEAQAAGSGGRSPRPSIRTFSPSRTSSPHTHYTSRSVDGLLRLDNMDGSNPPPPQRLSKCVQGQAPKFVAPPLTPKKHLTKRGCPPENPAWHNMSDIHHNRPAGEAGPSDDFLHARPALATQSVQRARSPRPAAAAASLRSASTRGKGRPPPVATDPITHRYG